MIRKIICTGIIIMVFSAGYAQKSVNQLFDEFAKMKGTTKVDVGKFTIALASIFAGEKGISGKSLDQIEVIDLGNVDESIKQRFAEAVKNIRDKDFETMISTSSNGERVKVLLRIKDDIISELVVLSTGKSSAMVRMKGKINRSDIDKLVSEHQK